MQTPSPTGALGSPPFYALGWRRMGKENDSLRTRYLDKVRKMREKRNKKLGGVRKPTSTLKPKAAPATPMDTTQSEAPTSKYTAEQKLLLDRFRISIDTFGRAAEAEWVALWPQSLGPGLEGAERAMRSFHLPNGELELYIQEYDPDASDEMVTVQVFVNLCYLLCKGETEDFRNTWAEMEVAYAEYLQKVASVSYGSAMDVPMTAPTAAPGTYQETLPTGPVWSGREAKKDAVAKTCLYAVKGAIVGVGSTYLSAQGVATLVGMGLLGPGLAATIATGGSAVLVGNFVLKPLLERVIAGAAALPVTTSGVLLDGALAVPLRTGELELVNYEDTLEKLVSEEKGEIVKFLCGIGPNSLQGQVAIDNQRKLFNKPMAELTPIAQRYIRRGQLEIGKEGLTIVGKLNDGKVTNRFRKHHITAQIPEATDSSLLSGGQEAVMDRMDLAGKRNRWWHFKKAREEYVKEVTQLDSAEGADGSILPNRPWRVYGMLAASHLASGFAQQRFAKQKLTVDYLESMHPPPEAAEKLAKLRSIHLVARQEVEASRKNFQDMQAGTNQQQNQAQLKLNRDVQHADAKWRELYRALVDDMSAISAAAQTVKAEICSVSDAHMNRYILEGQQANPRTGIVRAFDLRGDPTANPPVPSLALGRNVPPLSNPPYHTAYLFKKRHAQMRPGLFKAYITRDAEEERRTLVYYFFRDLGAPLIDKLDELSPVGADGKRDYSAIGGWLGMNPVGGVRGELLKFYQMIDWFNAEKRRLIDGRVKKLLTGETNQSILADTANSTIIAQLPPCNGTAAAPNGAVSVVDAAFARLAV